ncbi:50S ribosomal protein L24 [Candidatus Azambacteria bacterium]|nr:50S ribosomal protein L24 [Candidatus Azambacteria bacterium]
MKVKKGDNVIVLSGKDKGKSGKVLQVIPQKERVVVEGANLRKRHMRPRRQGEKGQIVEKATPMHSSNVMVVCGKCSKPTRVGYNISKEEKVRICKKCSAVL